MTTTTAERVAAWTAACGFGVADVERAARSLLANYAYQRDRLARIAAGCGSASDLEAHPDDGHVERDHALVVRELR